MLVGNVSISTIQEQAKRVQATKKKIAAIKEQVARESQMDYFEVEESDDDLSKVSCQRLLMFISRTSPYKPIYKQL